MLFSCVSVIVATYRKVSALRKEYEGFERSLHGAVTMKIHGCVVSWRLRLATPHSAEVKAHALSI